MKRRFRIYFDTSAAPKPATETLNEPAYRHEIEMAWEGVVEIKDAVVVSIVLVGRGTYALEWRGLTKEEDRFSQLMAGRAIDEKARVAFAFSLKRAEKGTENSGDGPPDGFRDLLASPRDAANFIAE